MTGKPDTRIQRRGEPGAAIIAELERLRDARRLGVHMWETEVLYRFPDKSYTDLSRYIPGRTLADDPAKMSLSLLPAKQDGITMHPYDYGATAGYLIDLSENQPHPPLIAAGDVTTLESGMAAHAKKYPTDTIHCDLDTLGERYRDLHTPYHPVASEGIGEYNEVVASVGHEHVKAIVHPIYERNPSLEAQPFHRLEAILNGLAHEQPGKPSLPVVLYHVTMPNKGNFTYLGQGCDELVEKAAAKLEQIAKNPLLLRKLIHHPSIWFIGALEWMLGVDVTQPLEPQIAALRGSLSTGEVKGATR